MIPATGRVVRIRVNPLDCLACIDVLTQVGIDPKYMSFAQVVSMTLGTVLESLRQNNITPMRDGFEYNQMMAQFGDEPKKDRAQKLRISKSLQLSAKPLIAGITLDPKVQMKKLRFTELAEKANRDMESLTPGEATELQELVLELNPL